MLKKAIVTYVHCAGEHQGVLTCYFAGFRMTARLGFQMNNILQSVSCLVVYI